jgi:hypothetical protein
MLRVRLRVTPLLTMGRELCYSTAETIVHPFDYLTSTVITAVIASALAHFTL